MTRYRILYPFQILFGLAFIGAFLIVPEATAIDEEPRAPRAASVPKVPGMSVLIVGPESVSAGTLVKIDASRSDADAFVWKLAGGTADLYDIAENGRVVYFATSVPGTYRFLLAVAKAQGDKVPALTIAEHVVQVQGATPPPPPGPGPNPPGPLPDTLTAGKYNLARTTRDLVLGAIAADKRGPAALFSSNYTVVASKVAAGAIQGLSAANAELATKNRDAAGNDLEMWKASVFTPLGLKMTDLVKSGTLAVTDPAALAAAYNEISLGFAAAAGGAK